MRNKVAKELRRLAREAMPHVGEPADAPYIHKKGRKATIFCHSNSYRGVYRHMKRAFLNATRGI